MDSRTTVTGYDAAGRTVLESQSATLGTALVDVTTGYDAATGQVASTSDGSGTISRTYDSIGRLASYQDADGNTTTYGHGVVVDGEKRHKWWRVLLEYALGGFALNVVIDLLPQTWPLWVRLLIAFAGASLVTRAGPRLAKTRAHRRELAASQLQPPVNPPTARSVKKGRIMAEAHA